MQLIESNPPHFVNPYVQRMSQQNEWVFTEDRAKTQRGFWQKKQQPLHVEIGTGNGFHFAHYSTQHPQVQLVGFEIKFKTLVQTIERARGLGADNVRMIKGDARSLGKYFAPNEVDKVMVHFPDPWPKRRQQKNRLMNGDFFRELTVVLKPGGCLEFKTDHPGYFQFAAFHAARSPLTMTHYTEDLHRSFKAANNFVTGFETFFLKKNQCIYSFTLHKY